MTGNPVLVVDDEKNIRLALARSLEPLGLPIQTAVNGEEALQKLQGQEFSLVFLDLRMPGMDGLDVLRRIRQMQPRVRVIIITAHGTIESAVDAMKLGAVDFLQKPFGPAEIRGLTVQVLARDAPDGDGLADPGALVALARRYMADRRPDAAGEAARRAIAAGPTRPEAYNLLGALHELAGEMAEAQKLYRAAVDVDPTYQPGASNLERITSWERRGSIDLGSDDDPAPGESRPAGGSHAG